LANLVRLNLGYSEQFGLETMFSTFGTVRAQVIEDATPAQQGFVHGNEQRAGPGGVRGLNGRTRDGRPLTVNGLAAAPRSAAAAPWWTLLRRRQGAMM
jgi:hypothetical protein